MIISFAMDSKILDPQLLIFTLMPHTQSFGSPGVPIVSRQDFIRVRNFRNRDYSSRTQRACTPGGPYKTILLVREGIVLTKGLKWAFLSIILT